MKKLTLSLNHMINHYKKTSKQLPILVINNY